MKALTKRQKQMIDALKNNMCNVSHACKAIKINRNTHYQWIHKSDSYKKAVEEVENALIDFAESALLKNIKDGNVTAQIFFLKTKGKERGYTERQEIEINKDLGLNIKFE